MLDADKSHLDVMWVSQSLYSGPLSNPDSFLSLIAVRIRQVVLYTVIFCWKKVRIFCSAKDSHIFPTNNNSVFDNLVSICLTS